MRGLINKNIIIATMSCKHAVVYLGVTNLIYKDKAIGAVDLWRCAKCRKVFAEEKRLGVLELASEVGMPSIEDDQRWAVLVCKLQDMNERWKLVKVRSNDKVKHKCLKADKELIINDFRIDDDNHMLLLLDQYINKEVRID